MKASDPPLINSSAHLEALIQIILPAQYQSCYEEILPVSMGSAGLKYGDDGLVAWNEIWGSFCDLAMAGGPPHRGTLLEPGRPSEIAEHPERYQEVVEEICRGISLVTGLAAECSETPGWVHVFCDTSTMAGWLARAIVIENVAARCDGYILSLPAAPSFRLEKEIKNVITSIAKTFHYWTEHTSQNQRQLIANAFMKLELQSSLIEPAVGERAEESPRLQKVVANISAALQRHAGLSLSAHRYAGWLGVDFVEVNTAIRMVRLLVVSNVLARREGTAVFVPLNPSTDPTGERVTLLLTSLVQSASAPSFS